jgi:predicted CopG family antitoxin
MSKTIKLSETAVQMLDKKKFGSYSDTIISMCSLQGNQLVNSNINQGNQSVDYEKIKEIIRKENNILGENIVSNLKGAR